MSRDIDYSKTLTQDEAEYVRQRPWLISDLDLQGIEIKWPAESHEDDEAEDDEEEIDYNDLTVDQLRAEIKARNDAGSDIDPDGNKKADLIAALVADDEAQES